MSNGIPVHDERGLLPQGFYPVQLEEFIHRFVTAEDIEKRTGLFELYIQFCIKCLDTTALICHYVNGSYVTKKVDPEDIDLLVILDGITVDDGPDELYEEYVEIDNREKMKEDYSCHVWCVLDYPEDLRVIRDYHNHIRDDAISWWQTNFLDEERAIVDPDPKGVIILSKDEIEKMRSL